MKPRFGIRISSRVVILTPQRVYKFPVNRRGWLQGINERAAWDEHKESGYLAPLIWSFGGVVCMQRVRPTQYVPPQMVLNVKMQIPALNIANCDLWNVANWGEYQNRRVLLDYGISEQVAAMY